MQLKFDRNFVAFTKIITEFGGRNYSLWLLNTLYTIRIKFFNSA